MEKSCGNIFKDLGLPCHDELKRISELEIENEVLREALDKHEKAIRAMGDLYNDWPESVLSTVGEAGDAMHKIKRTGGK